MISSDDWRLCGQQNYLQNVTLVHDFYVRYSEQWDHDHCRFCMKRFMEKVEGPPMVGYHTSDFYYWICEECFEDFRVMFNFQIVD